MTRRERVIKAIKLENPDRIPFQPGVLQTAWIKYGRKLEKLLSRYPTDMEPLEYLDVNDVLELPKNARKGSWVDEWGCKWEVQSEGMFGYVKGHPLSDLSHWSSYQFPKVFPSDRWLEKEKRRVEKLREENYYVQISANGATGYGVLSYRMEWLRGYENLFMDIAQDSPIVYKLRDAVLKAKLNYLKEILKLDADGIFFGDDWGTQSSLIISPEKWRKIFKPAYARIFEVVHKAGKNVHFCSDGYTLQIISDLIEIGVNCLTVSTYLMGAQEIAKSFTNKVCFQTDLDRQYILPKGSTQEVSEHVKSTIDAFKDESCSFILRFEVGPDVPLKNVEAACEAFMKYREIK